MIDFILRFIGHVLSYIRVIPSVLWLNITKDAPNFFKNKLWKDYRRFGISMFLGQFGQGKTSSMVYTALSRVNRFPNQITIISNIKLNEDAFQNAKEIRELHNIADIICAPEKSIILIDEASTWFNSRSASSGAQVQDKKTGKVSKTAAIPPALMSSLMTLRHNCIEVFMTSQSYMFIDVSLRRVADKIVTCHSIGRIYPFTRLITNKTYDGEQFASWYDNKAFRIQPINFSAYCQSEFLRLSYDTHASVSSLQRTLEDGFLTQEEILQSYSISSGNVSGDLLSKRQTNKMLNK